MQGEEGEKEEEKEDDVPLPLPRRSSGRAATKVTSWISSSKFRILKSLDLFNFLFV